ncbi:NRPS-like enzyme, putative [Talaromyces stipitatus ATCC 10500]|uniref:NRPS-like enzyme, putative n=1 Tax=Talaromyces stipitatus (strain ATCC 10500 / CBS 375.48 / QM 6759 / NRRL 1006) TaxID=441959 RepID=B8MAK0_TALSN|nr:NRPS-like enzyme, putative [Talaromyces stipitatus ATCC 10500]EED17424.1 NRPS-like enzyme, putative [Talaromyces stipitatus ATCC 10500]
MGKGDLQTNSQQLLPSVLKTRAQCNPDGAWAQFPVSDTTYALGLETATNLQVFNAVNKVAWLLDGKLQPSSSFETIAYIGPFDLRYFIVVLAAIKVGYKTFLPSPRNSKVAQLHLLEKLQCKKLVTTDPQLPAVNTILEGPTSIETTVHIPSLRDLLDSSDGTPEDYPYEKSYEEAKDEPIFILHTSGSTGIPKPLIYTHQFVTRTVNVTALPAPSTGDFISGNDTLRTGHWFTFLAPFHISGIGFGLMVSAFNDCVPVFPLPGQPLTTDQFLDAVRHCDMDWAFVLPFILEDLSKELAALELVSQKLSHLYFAGGSVPRQAGDTVASKMPVYQTTGSSEVSLLSQIHSPDRDLKRKNWSYIQLHPTLNVEYRHHYGDLYEMVIVRSPSNEEFQPVFLHFPELKEYETRDLLSPHPDMPGLWRYRGRKDDIIVFLNGEKTNPISFEQEVSRHPEIRSVLVAGSQRFEACLLVERHNTEILAGDEHNQFIERIWPLVQMANNQCPAHARVSRDNILLVNPSKPMARAAKGTVQRAATLAMYEKEINTLYAANASNRLLGSKLASIDPKNPETLLKTLHDLVAEVTQWDSSSFDNESDFFTLAMDSLQALHLSRELNVAPSMIYGSPSVEQLMKSVLSQSDSNSDLATKRIKTITDLLHKYEAEIDKIAAVKSEYSKQEPSAKEDNKLDQRAVVALTGSTGAVGSYILQKLLQNDHIAHVYCFNRAADSETLQKTRNAKRGIQTELPPDRVTFLTTDLSQPNFGLNEELYQQLQSNVTHFIHNAWPVNFNQALQSFQSSLSGVLGIISFTAHAKRQPVSTLFLSSISAVSSYHKIPDAVHNDLVPEEIIINPMCSAPMGYAESKYVAERMLNYAAQKLDHKNIGIARVGQIAGTVTKEQGSPHGWNRHEWLPSLVISSRYLKAIPETLGSSISSMTEGNEDTAGVLDRIDWVPIDQLASLLVEILFGLSSTETVEGSGARVFHPINPNWVKWQSLLPTLIDILDALPSSADEKDTRIKAVKYDEWLNLLKSTTTIGKSTPKELVTADVLWENPAVKLLEFYTSLSGADNNKPPKPLATKQTSESYPSLLGLEAIKSEWLYGWIRDWVLDSSV